jgi:putative ABC transport system permease protein
MKLRDIATRSVRSLKQAKIRTLLTSLAIGVGAFTIVLSFAVGAGGRNYASDIISSNTNPRELFVQAEQDDENDPDKPKKYSESQISGFGDGFSMNVLKQEDIEKISEIDGVESVTPIYSNILVKYITRSGQDRYVTSVRAYNSAVKLDYSSGNADLIDDDGIIILENFVEPLGFSNANDAIGGQVQLAVSKATSQEMELFDFTITGVIKSSALAASPLNDMQISIDNMKMLYDYSQKDSPSYGSYVGSIVLAKENIDVVTVKENLTAAGYRARTAEDLMSLIFQFINVLQAILIGFGILAVLTSVFGIINTQYISVLERTQQIGLMKALGMRKRDVGRLFKLEAAWIGFIGGSIGSILAVIAGTIANPRISEALNLGDINLIIFEPISVIAVIVILVFVSVTSGILPARKASKLDPIVALRTE